MPSSDVEAFRPPPLFDCVSQARQRDGRRECRAGGIRALRGCYPARRRRCRPLAESGADDDLTPSALATVEQRESLSLGFLALLERPSPAERAVFVLREAFDYTYDEIASAPGRTALTCRQLHGSTLTAAAKPPAWKETFAKEPPLSADEPAAGAVSSSRVRVLAGPVRYRPRLWRNA